MSLAFLLAAIELISPIGGTVVKLVPDAQREVMNLPTLTERIKLLQSDRKGSKNLKHDKFWRQANPVVFEWKTTAGEKGPWQVTISKCGNLADARVELIDGRALKTNELGIVSWVLPRANLELGETYYWQVEGNVTCGEWSHGRNCGCTKARPVVSSPVGSFKTDDFAPRWIAVEGRTQNFRDLGGRRTSFGCRVRQGLIYRGQGLNDNSVDGVVTGRNRLMVEDVAYLTGTLGIKTDLDLRSDREVAKMTESPLGGKVKFIHNSSASYKGIFEPSGMETMAKNFRVFCDKANYPIYFHCIGGADRTGALGYVLNAVLGVDRHELETDWESTFYPKIPDENKDPDFWCRESHFNTGFAKYGDANASWNDRVILYLKACGITLAEIEKFRSIMLER